MQLNSPDDTQKTPAKSSPLLSSQTKDTKLSSEEIVGACVTFLVAGYETTSTLLTWACYQLALNPDIQQRLYDEISSTDFTEYENLVTLPYLDAVLHEVLRINPPIVLFQRIAHQDYVIEKTNTKIIPGTLITIPVYSKLNLNSAKLYFTWLSFLIIAQHSICIVSYSRYTS